MDKENESNDFNSAIEAINKNIKSAFDKQDERLSNLDHKFETKFDAREEPKQSKTSWLDEVDDDGSEYLTKSEVKEMMKNLQNDFKNESRKIAKSEIEGTTRKSQRDVQAFQEFPEMNKLSKEFNSSYLKDVETEIENRCRNGRDAEDNDLLYDCASAVDNRWLREGKKIPLHIAKRDNDKLNYKNDSFETKKVTSYSGSKPTEAQIELASRVGLSKERLSQHFENIKKKR